MDVAGHAGPKQPPADLVHAALQALPVGIAVIDPTGEILAVNDAWIAFAERAGAEPRPGLAVGANYLEVCRRASAAHDADAARALAGIEDVLGGRQPRFSMEYLCPTPRDALWFSMTVAPLHQAARSGAVISHLDVTDRKQSEEASRASTERLRRAAHAAGFGTYELDIVTGANYWSPELKRIAGLPEDADVPLERVLELVHPDDRTRVQAAIEASIDPRGDGDYEDEHRLMRPDGALRWIQIRGSTVFEGEGARRRAIAAAGIALDISARKAIEEELRESERRIQQALRVSRSFTFDWDPRTDLVHRSVSCSDILLLAGDEVVRDTSRRYFERVHPDDRALFAAVLASLTPASPGYSGLEYRVKRGDGSEVTLEEIGHGRFDADGNLTRVVGITTDITERKRAEAALRDADRRKDEFLAMLAHELRNPLAPVRNAAALLARTLPDEPALQAPLEMIRRQVGQLTRLVDDLLDVSRIAGGRIELKPELLEIGLILEQAAETVQPLVTEKRQQLRIDRPHGRLFVRGDRARLVQAIGNLLHNAAKYTDTDGTLVLEVRSGAGTLELEVRDTGVGMSAELLPHVFDLFVQGERTLDRAQGGLGIGLSVVKRLVEVHGGTVEARSAGPGRGSSFTLRLPRILRPAAGEAAAPRAGRATPRRILVVDDNVDAADSLVALLRLDGHDASAVYDAASALAAIEAREPEVVLLDLGMPQMDGFEAARRIRARETGGNAIRSLRLVAFTGYGQESDRERAKAAGFDAHLVKPADLDALAQALGAPSAAPVEHG